LAPNENNMVIFWFRRDLRLYDNVGLFHALSTHVNVLPIFIFDPGILEDLPKDDARVYFIWLQLEKMQNELLKIGKSMAVFHGNPVAIFEKITSEHHIEAVFTNHDYEPNARKRDKAVFELLNEKGIGFKTSKDQVIFEKNEVTKDDGKPYVVYTPYMRKWKETLNKSELIICDSENYISKISDHAYPFLSLEEIGFEPSKISLPDFDVREQLINQYEETRNFPAIKGTSLLGVHLRFGAVSIRKMLQLAMKSKNEIFWNELIWREFFMQIIWHFPHTINKSFKEKYDGIKWDNNEILFKKWCEGNTGYPFVDAGMRELNATGFMHNRVRMITASFLCKHLLIDWRWGETYFAQKLLDYEQSSNVGNWQWAAGSGVDAAPYFRIFNPTEQIKKFDKDLKYIKKWIPELETCNYPKPIVDHKEAREKCLKTYKMALE
jgi:deoxyribodipyrimidine photo-lyase